MNIRNFSIIAHIDHGKSTLADRMLEVTGTVEKRKMKEQVLDSMELERERGITIKMQPVRMDYVSSKPGAGEGESYILNLIDTPGHIDFSYEVSRSMKAVEGAILLVDATQGVQAQTITTLEMAMEAGLTIIPAVSKIDSPLALADEVKDEIVKLIGCDKESILECSGKTGQGVDSLLQAVIDRVPPPNKDDDSKSADDPLRALVFDFQYSDHKGVIVFVRLFGGKVRKNEAIKFCVAGKKFNSLEVGIFSPEERPVEELVSGEIGYIVTGIKEPGIASVGDTIVSDKNSAQALSGYMTPRPVVWASVFPESQNDFDVLRQALSRLRLSDSSLSYEEEASSVLGRGYRCGFLGMLHLEIISERLRREFQLELIVTLPSINYEVTTKNGKTQMVYTPAQFPAHGDIVSIKEPWVALTIIVPGDYLGPVMQLLFDHEAEVGESETFGGERYQIQCKMPLRELMRGFFDRIKSATSGYASISYVMEGLRPADVVRLDVLVADENMVAFTRIVSRRKMEGEGEKIVEKLHKVLPRQLFVTKIQASALGRILSSKTISALRKDVTGYLYGGDITRKMKLLEKQKKGKKKMKARGKVNIGHDVFLKMMRLDD